MIIIASATIINFRDREKEWHHQLCVPEPLLFFLLYGNILVSIRISPRTVDTIAQVILSSAKNKKEYVMNE